jgi:hypothetical protein
VKHERSTTTTTHSPIDGVDWLLSVSPPSVIMAALPNDGVVSSCRPLRIGGEGVWPATGAASSLATRELGVQRPTCVAALTDQDAALSLCALGRSRSTSPDENDAAKSYNQGAAHWGDFAAAPHDGDGSATYSSDHTTAAIRQKMQTTSDPIPPPTVLCSVATGQTTSTSVVVTQATENAPPKKARPVKPKDPSRDTSVPFDEMKRLMRVYGSLKCLRNRLPADAGKQAKAESIKRKFYRWFPDLEERFVRTEDGWYRPKAGHEEEIQYREAMRRGDQDCLVKKRSAKRSSTKLNAHPAV